MASKPVFVRCTFSPGGFPSEKVFRITDLDGGEWAGTSPSHYCYAVDMQTILPDLEKGEVVEGFLPGHVVGERVYLPNGEIYELPSYLLEDLP